MKSNSYSKEHTLDYFKHFQYLLKNFPEQYIALAQQFRWSCPELYKGFSKYFFFPQGKSRTKSGFVRFIRRSENFVSKNALNEIMASDGRKKLNLKNEHTYPVKVFLKDLVQFDFEKSSYEDFVKFFNSKVIHSIVTEEEDNRLTSLKLKDCMPSDWDGKDSFARYKKAGIELYSFEEARKILETKLKAE